MRAVLLLPLVTLALISTAGAQQQTPLNCQNCWATARSKIPECKSLSKDDLAKLGKLTDAEIASISDDHELAPIKACLCALSEGAPEILASCENRCPDEMSRGLQAEASIVGKGVCNVPKEKAQSDENSADNSTSAGGEDGTGSEGNSASNEPEENPEGGDANNKPSTAGASSVQWSGALLTVVAAMVSAVTF